MRGKEEIARDIICKKGSNMKAGNKRTMTREETKCDTTKRTKY